jgi:hypothetical protein
MSISPSQKGWKLWIKIQLTKYGPKRTRVKTSPQTCVALKEKESGSSWLLFSCPFTNDTTFIKRKNLGNVTGFRPSSIDSYSNSKPLLK